MSKLNTTQSRRDKRVHTICIVIRKEEGGLAHGGGQVKQNMSKVKIFHNVQRACSLPALPNMKTIL